MKTKRVAALFAAGAMLFATNAFANAYVTVKVYDGQEDRGKVSGGKANAPIKVTVDKKGVLKLSGKIEGVSISGSTVLPPEIDGSLTGYLPCSMKTAPMCSGYFLFRFTYKNSVPSLELKYAGGCG